MIATKRFGMAAHPGKVLWLIALCGWLTLAGLGACDTTKPAQETTSETPASDAAGNDTAIVESAPEGKLPQDTQADQPKAKVSRASGPEKALVPAERGPYAVGVLTLRLTDESRIDPKTKEPRPMVIEVWYPAVDEAAKTPKDAYEVSTDAPDAVKQKIKDTGLEAPRMPQDAHRDARPLYEEGPYPLILYSHGSGGIRYQSVFQTTHLASHGYVVVSPDHHGNTLYDLFINPDAQSTPNLLAAAGYRPIDMQFALDAVKKRVETEGDVLHKLASFDKIGMTGHSFGGLTSILVTRTIPNLGVVIPQAPATSFIKALGVTDEHLNGVPFMVLASQDDRTLDYQKEQKSFFDLLLTAGYFGAERHLVSFVRGGHFTFSDICQLDLKKFADKLGFGNVASILDDGCAAHNIPAAEAHKLINHYATAIFNVILRKSTPSTQYLKQLETTEIEYVFKKPE